MKRTITHNTSIEQTLIIALAIALLISITNQVFSQCDPPNAVSHLDINNVDATIRNGQVLWTDGSSAGYEIPKESGLHSIFAGNFWIGGISPDNQLKLAGGTYGTNGTDYYPGPISMVDAETSEENCAEYNQLFEVCLEDCLSHLAYFEALVNNTVDQEFPNGYSTPEAFFDYPAHGNVDNGEALYLAPFYDNDFDGFYDPSAGDCPLFASMMGDGFGCNNCNALDGHKAVFWIDNDKGGDHTATGGEDIGLEIHNVAYAFTSDNYLDNTTFYKKKIINRGTQTLMDVYTSIWVDADIGNGSDDFIGCDIDRALGYCYNGDPVDEESMGSDGYGENPPAIGIRLLHAPYMDADGLDNDDDGIVDNEQLGMDVFMFHNNSAGITGSPSIAQDYYKLMQGNWLNGESLTFGGTGLGGEDETNFAFAGNTYSDNEVEWTEVTAGNPPGDRRFIMSSGPFTLEPGDEHCIIYAVVNATPSEGSLDAVTLLQLTSDSVQSFYDNCTFCSPPMASIVESSMGLEYEFNTYTLADDYLWTFGDGNTSEEQNPIHEYTSEGEYEVCLHVSNECGSDTQCLIINAQPVNVEELAAESVEIEWNHSQNILHVISEDSSSHIVEIFDIAGRMVIQEEFNHQTNIKLDLLKSSIYIVKVVNKEGKSVLVERIVKG